MHVSPISIRALPSFIAQRRLFVVISLMIFFWAIYDSFVSYFTPILITQEGFSNTQMGLIYACSSLFGALFDFGLSMILRKAHYRRLFLVLLLLCAGYPLLIWHASTLAVFLIAMMIWGLYYDMFTFAHFDFVSREVKEEDHAASFGYLTIVKSIGYLVGPLLAGSMVLSSENLTPAYLAMVFLFFAFLFWVALSLTGKKKRSNEVKASAAIVHTPRLPPVSMKIEALRWAKVGKRMMPVVLFVTVIFLFDAVYWTIGPLLSDEFTQLPDFGGWFLAAAIIPGLISVWFIKKISSRYGKKRTAFVSFFVACIFLYFVGLSRDPFVVLLLVFCSSFMTSLALPSLLGAIADYLKESRRYDSEIIGIEDLAVNSGYIIGPVVAGYLSDQAGNLGAFSWIALIGGFVVLILFVITPKEIDFHDKYIK